MKKILTVISVVLVAVFMLVYSATADASASSAGASAPTAGVSAHNVELGAMHQVGLGVQASVRVFDIDPNEYAREFDNDTSKYLVIFMEENANIMDVQVQGPVPEDVEEVELFRRTYQNGVYSTWGRQIVAECEINSDEGRFSCELPFTDDAFNYPYQMMVVEPDDDEADILNRAHTPAFFLSEGFTSITAAAELVAYGLGIFDKDLDNDGIKNDDDNCFIRGNEDQENVDNDGRGDVCDNDIDHDGIINERDNCPSVINPDQVDSDDDGKGDKCEALIFKPWLGLSQLTLCVWDMENGACKDDDQDGDGDGIVDGEDQCPEQPETYVLATLRPADGILDGCPDSEGDITKEFNPDIGDTTDDDTDGDNVIGGGGCMLTGGQSNSIALIFMALAFIPMAIRRRRSA